MERIYLAGKIAGHDDSDWRYTFAPVYDGYIGGSDSFPESVCERNGRKFIYTGPYFMGEAHGSIHSYEMASSYGFTFCDCKVPGNMFYACESGVCPRPKVDTTLLKLASVCLSAVDRSDVVLAWVEEGAYGTAVEIGYAVGKGKRVIVAGPGVFDRDLWFLFAAAKDQIIRSPSPVKFVDDYLNRRFNRESFESPIERSMYEALKPVLTPRLEVISQYQIGQYRADIAIFGAGVKIVVECDGHEFHEKTREQAARDKKRDVDLIKMGWTVLHFTGSQIYNRLSVCVDDVVTVASRM